MSRVALILAELTASGDVDDTILTVQSPSRFFLSDTGEGDAAPYGDLNSTGPFTIQVLDSSNNLFVGDVTNVIVLLTVGNTYGCNVTFDDSTTAKNIGTIHTGSIYFPNGIPLLISRTVVGAERYQAQTSFTVASSSDNPGILPDSVNQLMPWNASQVDYIQFSPYSPYPYGSAYLTLSCITPSSTIYFTTSSYGTTPPTPTTSSTVYTTPIPLSGASFAISTFGSASGYIDGYTTTTTYAQQITQVTVYGDYSAANAVNQFGVAYQPSSSDPTYYVLPFASDYSDPVGLGVVSWKVEITNTLASVSSTEYINCTGQSASWSGNLNLYEPYSFKICPYYYNGNGTYQSTFGFTPTHQNPHVSTGSGVTPVLTYSKTANVGGFIDLTVNWTAFPNEGAAGIVGYKAILQCPPGGTTFSATFGTGPGSYTHTFADGLWANLIVQPIVFGYATSTNYWDYGDVYRSYDSYHGTGSNYTWTRDKDTSDGFNPVGYYQNASYQWTW